MQKSKTRQVFNKIKEYNKETLRENNSYAMDTPNSFKVKTFFKIH